MIMTTTMITITMNKQIVTENIKLWGIVQGVGFRPFVAKLARFMDMKGRVLNTGGLVEIRVTGHPDKIDRFIQALKEQKPEPAEIVHIARFREEVTEYEDFRIEGSLEGEDALVMIPADLAWCDSCQREFHDPENPRYHHPFISCMICGPRFTIMDRVPYDRENTRMDPFPMCDFCAGEYTDPGDRRYHAQTISCHECGPRLEFILCGRNPGDSATTNEDYSLVSHIRAATDLLKQGQVIGFKSVGGYNLVGDPFRNEAAGQLRKLKGREEKPFALMFPNLETIRRYCISNETEEKLLLSSARPILLLEKKPWASGEEPSELKKSRFIGAFLPSMGAQQLLLEAFGGPLIMTSANHSGYPIITEDRIMEDFAEESQRGDLGIAGILRNDREINLGVDDSVVRVIDGQPQMIRRSKGYAPVPLHMGLEEEKIGKAMVLAAGGDLKSSFALSKGPFSTISPFYGDLDSEENSRRYREGIHRMEDFFHIKPELAVCDLHPGYRSVAILKKYSQEQGIPLRPVQHHHAHVASVMAEHRLRGPVMGVSMDGTGYGTDGKIWGGEILLCEEERFIRLSHLKYIRMIGGDSSMKEAWKSAMCYYYDQFHSDRELAADEFTIDIGDILERADIQCRPEWPLVKAALDHRVNTLESASMGRLFDGVSSLLNICSINEYEGQCAILLEDAAARGLKNPRADRGDDLALAFHRRVATTVVEQCRKHRETMEVDQVALTGGVFQNRILMEECLRLLRGEGFRVYYNISVSPNDGGIALGQNYIGAWSLIKGKGRGGQNGY
jgi:hydrogenase maturation protein HypF